MSSITITDNNNSNDEKTSGCYSNKGQHQQQQLPSQQQHQQNQQPQQRSIQKSHPVLVLREKALEWGLNPFDVRFARRMDEEDQLRRFRDLFCYPKKATLPKVDLELIDPNEESVYFCGNSLGLMPKSTPEYVKIEMDKWADMGVHGHRHGALPWAFCDEHTTEQSALLVGAESNEVAVMNGLTINLHLLLISFYQPTKQRHKILLEDHSFPSDHYCVESQIRQRGFDPETSMLLVKPRPGEHLLHTEDILDLIEKEGDSVSVILLPGVHYFTGQLFDMETITRAGQAKGCYVGFDLAHAIGNVEIRLHDWNVDFAAWCNYKYLCGGAGCLAGAYIHNRHESSEFPKLLGWWGHRIETRFNMTNAMELSPGIAGYRVTNPAGLLAAAVKASLDIFSQTSMSELRSKSKLLTAYLEYFLTEEFPRPKEVNTVAGDDRFEPYVDIITPTDPDQRGAQLSVQFSLPITHVFEQLTKRGVVIDTREPDVLRVTPCPIYNSFEDVHRFMQVLRAAMTAA